MTAVVGLAMMALALVVAVRLTPDSHVAHRAGSAMAAGTGALLLLAGTVRPDLLPWAVAALCVCLLWLALAPAVERMQPARLDGEGER